MSTAHERRKKLIEVLREMYLKAQADVESTIERKEKLQSISHDSGSAYVVADVEMVESFRKGVLAGIHRVAEQLLGCLDIDCVTKGVPMCDEELEK